MCSKEYYNDLSLLPRLSQEEQNELFKRYKAGDEKALNKLIEANLRLVILIAKKYRTDHYQDLINEGNIGLIEAVKRYNPEKNIKFSYYASFWIKKHMNEYIVNDQTIRIPVNKYYEMKKNNELLTKLIEDFCELFESADVYNDNEDSSQMDQIIYALKYLNDKQKLIFINYHGINTIPLTLTKIASVFANELGGITDTRCGQILSKAEEIIREKVKK